MPVNENRKKLLKTIEESRGGIRRNLLHSLMFALLLLVNVFIQEAGIEQTLFLVVLTVAVLSFGFLALRNYRLNVSASDEWSEQWAEQVVKNRRKR